MRQITQKEAIKIYNSKVWKKWSDFKKVKVQLFQNSLLMDFSEFHRAVEKILDRPVYTHEFGLNRTGLIQEFLGIKKAPTFNEILDLIPNYLKTIIITKET